MHVPFDPSEGVEPRVSLSYPEWTPTNRVIEVVEPEGRNGELQMSKKKESEVNLSSKGTELEPSKRAIIAGPELVMSLPTSQGKALDLSYWDLWFALVAVLMDKGNLDRLANRIKEKKGFYYDKRSVERKRCHIRDLKRRLEEASIIPADIVLAAGDLAKTEKRRALKKVSESIHRKREFSEPMRNTPRERRFPFALRGYWDKFPVSPKSYTQRIGAHFRSKTFYSKNASFGIARTLDGYVEEAKKLLGAGKAAQAQALLRGWMTVIVEIMAKADDSFGSIGMSFEDGFTAYLKIPLEQTGIDERVFFITTWTSTHGLEEAHQARREGRTRTDPGGTQATPDRAGLPAQARRSGDKSMPPGEEVMLTLSKGRPPGWQRRRRESRQVPQEQGGCRGGWRRCTGRLHSCDSTP